MMQCLHVTVDRALCEESCSALECFLSSLEGVTFVELDRDDIAIRYDERKLPPEQLLAMTKSSAELLGYHVAFFSGRNN